MANYPTQEFLKIKQIREGVVILKDKSLRGIMMVSSLNFALKSTEEQEAIIYQFQNFLNSLDFPCQIIVQSRKLNITGYLDKLKELEVKQENKLLKMQTAEYRKFIQGIIAGGSVMSKSFYIVAPYYTSTEMPGFMSKKHSAKGKSTLTEEKFQRGKYQLWQRMEFLALGLRKCGLRAAPLTTSEIIELMWTLYHPRQAEAGYYPEIPPELII